jgi:Homeodomain-like domain
MNKTYIGRLTDAERQALFHWPRRGKAAASKIKQAHMLLHVDAHGPPRSAEHVAKACPCHGNTVRNVRQRFVEPGLEAAWVRKKPARPARPRLLDGAPAAPVLALRGGPPPHGQAKWTLQVLADKLVELHVVETISYATVRQTLEKNLLQPHLHTCGGIPPEKRADFVAGTDFSWGRGGIAAKTRYAFGILSQGFQRRPFPDAMPSRQHTR